MNIERRRGDTKPDIFEVSLTRTGEIADIRGFSFLLTLNTLQSPLDDSTQVYQLVGYVEADSGVVQFSPDTIQANQVGIFYYDVQMTDALGRVYTLISGKYIYKQDITK